MGRRGGCVNCNIKSFEQNGFVVLLGTKNGVYGVDPAKKESTDYANL